MGRVEREREIDGEVFTVDEMDPEAAFELVADVAEIVGPAVAAITGRASLGSVLDSDTSELDIGAVVKAITSGMPKDKLKAIRRAMLAITHVRTGTLSEDGTVKTVKLGSVADALFRGKLMLQMKWLWFALEVQLSPFIGDLRELLSSRMGSLGLLSPSTSDGSGQSGAS